MKKIFVASLVVLVITLLGVFIWEKYFDQSYKQPLDQVSQSSLPLPSSAPTSAPVSDLVIPQIEPGNNPKINTATWKNAADGSGYSLSYPQNWFVTIYDSEGSNNIGQVQNWNPRTASVIGGMTQNEAKWDVSFKQKKFVDLKTALLEFDSADWNTNLSTTKFLKIEKFAQQNGLTMYFLTYESPSRPGDKVLERFVGAVFITPANTYFTWFGFPLLKNSDQTLKQIMLSVRKSS